MNIASASVEERITKLVTEFFADEGLDADAIEARFLAVRVLEVVNADRAREIRRANYSDQRETNMVDSNLGARRLRAQFAALSDRDLALFVRVAFSALNDEEFAATVADEIGVDADDLETFVSDVICTKPDAQSILVNADLVLGMYPDGIEDVTAEGT